MRMRRAVPVVLLALFPMAAEAQEARSPVEIGFRGSWSLKFLDRDNLSIFAVPAGMGGVTNDASLYVTVPVAGGTAIEPQIGGWRGSAGRSYVTQLAVGGQVMQFFSPQEASAPYAFVQGMLIAEFNDGADPPTEKSLGGGFGYRWVSTLGFRMEVRFRRRFERYEDNNELAILFGIGGLVRR